MSILDRLGSSIRIDLNGDGRPEFVVTSRDRAADTSGGRRQFDRVEVFSIDPSAQKFSSMFVDPVVSGTRVGRIVEVEAYLGPHDLAPEPRPRG